MLGTEVIAFISGRYCVHAVRNWEVPCVFLCVGRQSKAPLEAGSWAVFASVFMSVMIRTTMRLPLGHWIY